MKVIIVSEDNHGIITIAKNYQAGVRFLLDKGWIDDATEILDNNNELHMIMDFIGADWREQIFDWDIDKFNSLMDGQLLIREIEVYE